MGSCCVDFDQPEFVSEKWPRAKKEHTCCECRQTIPVGQIYEYVCGKWEGDFISFKTCEKCADLRASLMDVTCPAIGDLIDEYKEYLDSVGLVKYDDETDSYLYPENHLHLNS